MPPQVSCFQGVGHVRVTRFCARYMEGGRGHVFSSHHIFKCSPAVPFTSSLTKTNGAKSIVRMCYFF